MSEPLVSPAVAPEVMRRLQDAAECVLTWMRKRGVVDWTNRASVVDLMDYTTDASYALLYARNLLKSELQRTAQLGLFDSTTPAERLAER